MIEVQLVEELKHIFKLRQSMLINALELAKQLNISIDAFSRIVRLNIDKASIQELLEILSTLNKYMINIVEVLIEKYKELGASIAILNERGNEIKQYIDIDISKVKENLNYDPYIAVEQILEKITKLYEAYY